MILRVPVDLGRDEAARLAREELAKQVYRAAGPSPLERLLEWLLARFSAFLDGAAGVSPGGWVGLVAVALLVVAAVVAVRLKVGPLHRPAVRDTALFTDRVRTAAEHRVAADRHAAAGEWAEALRERLRAVVRGLEERAVLDERPGRTADEAAQEAGRVLPSCAPGLEQAARLFDDVWYGGRPAGPEHDASVRSLDDRVRATAPQPAYRSGVVA